MKKSVLLVVALLVSSFSFSQDERLTKIDEFLSYLFENDKFMGSLVIRKGDSLIFKKLMDSMKPIVDYEQMEIQSIKLVQLQNVYRHYDHAIG